MWRHIAANALTLLIVGLIAVAGIVAWGQSQYRSPGPLADAICLQVPSGTNMRRVAADLAERGAITNASIFRLGAEYAGKSDQLKAGSFLIREGMPMEEIVDAITRGGASTCGTEVVFRIGVAAQEIEVRELDPATERFEIVSEFDAALPAPPPALVPHPCRRAADRGAGRRGGRASAPHRP